MFSLHHNYCRFNLLNLLWNSLLLLYRQNVTRKYLLNSRLSLLPPTIRQLMETPPDIETEGTVRGHIKAVRQFRNVGFMDISDGSGYQSLSVIFADPETVFASTQFKVGQSVEITGRWAESRGVQPFELAVDPENPSHSYTVLGDVSNDYPIQKKRLTLQFLRTVPTLRHRTALLASVLRFRSRVETALGGFFEQHDVVKVTPPLITSSDCEGAGEQFQVRPTKEPTEAVEAGGFFGTEAYLTVSTQLHLEVLALSLNRVWTLTPCFRAEESNTNRHLSEFWMLEAELCYVSRVSQLTDFVEAMVRDVVRQLTANKNLSEAGAQHDLLGSRYSKDDVTKIKNAWAQVDLPEPWPSITYTQALQYLNQIKYKGRLKGRLEWGASILTEDEKWLAGTHFKLPVFITDYPKVQKPFYMLANEDDLRQPTVACFDLIVPELGELVGGSLREHDYDKLVTEMEARGMLREAMLWYLATRENGSVPHGGFGMGFERLLAYLAAVDNIRDISAFPRAPSVCAC